MDFKWYYLDKEQRWFSNGNWYGNICVALLGDSYKWGRGINTKQIRKPSQGIIVYDSYSATSKCQNWQGYRNYEYSGGAMSARHSEGFQSVFADCHAARLRPDEFGIMVGGTKYIRDYVSGEFKYFNEAGTLLTSQIPW